MRWNILANIFKVYLTLFRLGFHSDQEKDLEILLLRHQLNILERKRNQIVRADRVDRMHLSVLADRLKLISILGLFVCLNVGQVQSEWTEWTLWTENTSSTNSLERLDTIDWNTVHGYFVIEQES